ncbi:MAG: endonuclease NucS [Acidimicrobiales bacterium]
MRLVIARCTVDYNGRLDAHLPEALRLIMVKADGSVMVHADGGAYKPLNWMNPPNRLTEDGATWTVTNPKGETLTITLTTCWPTTATTSARTPAWSRTAWRPTCRSLLAADPSTLGEVLLLVRREYPTDIGPVDLLCRDAEGRAVAVEVKRQGEIDGVEQLTRYLDRLNRDPSLRPVRGIFVAQQIKAQAKVLAADRGIACVEVDYDELRGIERDQLSLF